MKNDYTHITLVVDRSGSMNSIRTDAQGGINTLLEEQKKVEGQCTITLYEFDDRYDRVFGPIDIKDAPNYDLVPRGSTALLDAVNRAINETGKFLKDLPEALRPSQVKFIVVTDGYENASREATRDMVRDAVKHQEDKYNWEFIYIGADPNTFQEAQRTGFTKSVRYTGAATADMYLGLNNAITNSRMTGASTIANMATTYGDTTQVTPTISTTLLVDEKECYRTR